MPVERHSCVWLSSQISDVGVGAVAQARFGGVAVLAEAIGADAAAVVVAFVGLRVKGDAGVAAAFVAAEHDGLHRVQQRGFAAAVRAEDAAAHADVDVEGVVEEVLYQADFAQFFHASSPAVGSSSLLSPAVSSATAPASAKRASCSSAVSPSTSAMPGRMMTA